MYISKNGGLLECLMSNKLNTINITKYLQVTKYKPIYEQIIMTQISIKTH